MKYTHFDDILPKRRTDFAMLYFGRMSLFTRTTGRNPPYKWRKIDLSPSMATPPHTKKVCSDGRPP